jgi:hypothetical protein
VIKKAMAMPFICLPDESLAKAFQAFLGHQNIDIFGCAFGSVRVDRHAAHDGIGDAS